MTRLYRIPRHLGVVLLGLLIWPLLFPLGLRRIYRILRRLVRKAARPALLWINAWLYKQSEEEVVFLDEQRGCLAAKASRERIRQMKLQRQRNQIARW